MTGHDHFVPVETAARLTGAKPRTIRRWIERGQVPAKDGHRGRLVDVAQVRQLVAEMEQYAQLQGLGEDGTDRTMPAMAGSDHPNPADAGATRHNADISGAVKNGPDRTDPANAITDQLQSLLVDSAMLDRFYRDNLELAGRLGFYQSEIQHLQQRIADLEQEVRMLKEPVEPSEPVGTGVINRSSSEQNGLDSGTQKVEEQVAECPLAEPTRESSAAPAANGQDASSGGTFKRFWRWLTQPV